MSKRQDCLLEALDTLSTASTSNSQVILMAKISKSIRLLKAAIDRHKRFSEDEIRNVIECLLEAMSSKRSLSASIRQVARRLDLPTATVQYLWYAHKSTYLGTQHEE